MLTFNTKYAIKKIKPESFPLNKGNLQRFIWYNYPNCGWITKDCSNYTLRFYGRHIVFPSNFTLCRTSYEQWSDYLNSMRQKNV